MNVQEIINISKERKTKSKKVIEKIVENIHKKILYYARLKREACTYTIPPLIGEVPIYDMESVVESVYKTLDSEGYIVSAWSNGKLDIFWNEKLVQQKVHNDSYVLNAEEQQLQKLSRRSKEIENRYSFLANPAKTSREQTVEEKLDHQIEQILHGKEKMQRKFSKLLN